MATDNNWVGYADRDFATIRKKITDKLIIEVPESFNKSVLNLFYKLVDIFAGVADNLNYYIDQVSREAFLVTQRKRINAMRIANQYDYRVKGAFSSEVLQRFYLADPAPANFTIPSGTIVKTPSGLFFETLQDAIILQGTDEITTPAVQREKVTFDSVVSNGLADQTFSLTEKVVDGSVSVKVNSENWTSLESFAYASYNSKAFVAGLDYNGLMQIRFGDGLNGLIPATDAVIEIEAYECEGDLGNTLAFNVTQFETVIASPPSALNTENISDGIGGVNAESIDDLKRRLPLFIRTLEVAHNEKTIKATAEQVSGVQKSYVEHTCGLPTKVYIAPSTNTEASNSLLATTLAYLNERKIISINIETATAGVVELLFTIDVTAISSATNSIVRQRVIDNLVSFYSVQNQEIKGTFELADLYSIIQSTDGVRKSKVSIVNYRPYAFRLVGLIPLVWNKTIKTTSATVKTWRLEFASSSTFELFINNVSDGIKNVSAILTYTEIDFSVQPESYVSGDIYEFKTYPYLDLIADNLALNEPSFFAVKSSDISITVTGGI